MAAPVSTSPRGSMEEGAPLLSPTDSQASFAPLGPPKEKKKKPWIFLVILIFFLIAVIDVGAFLAEAPKTRVFEANICVRYYGKHDPSKIRPDGTVEEALCKEDVIQQEMAMIFGWQDMFDAIPGILLAVPFGTLADKYGRKWIFTASLMGLQLQSAWVLLICYFRSLPLQLTWFSSAFYIVGGGPIVASAIGITMISDVVPPEKRTSVFLYLTAGVLVAELLAPLLAAKLMEKGDWIPLILALAIQQLGIFMACVLPETLHLRDLPEPRDTAGEDAGIELGPIHTDHGLRAHVRQFKDAMLIMARDKMIAMICLKEVSLGNQEGEICSIPDPVPMLTDLWAAYLLSFRAATNLVALTIFVPLVNLLLLKVFGFPAHIADLWLARGSIVLTTVSFFIMGVAAYPALLIMGLLVFNLGTGYAAAMRSTAIHVVGGQSSPDIGRLFAVIAIVESFGTMLAGPLLASLFEWGIGKGEPLIGIPFIASAVVFGVITLVTFLISFKDEKALLYVAVDDDDDFEPSTASPRRRSHQD